MHNRRLPSRSAGRRIGRPAGVVVLVLTVSALLISAASAGRSAAKKTSATLPTIVLIHGAWADSGSWDDVVRRLQADGYTVSVPPNPLRGLTNDSGVVASFLQTITGPVVLVGHSYGGAVITNAALGNSQVKALVFVDAFIPDQGETLTSLTAAGSCFAVSDISTVLSFVPFPGAPAGVFDSYVKPDVFRACFANGLSDREAALLAATQRPLATNVFGDPSGVPAWKTIPSWAVIGTDDRTITPASQLAMAQRANARITQIRAPHLAMIAKPAEVTKVIEQAARATT